MVEFTHGMIFFDEEGDIVYFIGSDTEMSDEEMSEYEQEALADSDFTIPDDYTCRRATEEELDKVRLIIAQVTGGIQ